MTKSNRKLFQNGDPRFWEYQRATLCDAEGDFEFAGIANGLYYVANSVVWTVPSLYIPEGGTIVKRIQVSGVSSQRVLLN